MKNKKLLTESDNYNNSNNFSYFQSEQSNPNIKSFNNKNNFRISQRANHINN